MIKYTTFESSKIVLEFIEKYKSGIEEKPTKIEYFCLTLKKPFYEKLNCAYLQTNDLKEGILYEGLTNRFFYINTDDSGAILMSELSKSVSIKFPKLLKDKMFWVCGNKKDKEVNITDMSNTNHSN